MENAYQRMVEVNPKGPILAALETLTKPGDIEAFVGDCVEAYRQHRDDPEAAVRINIGYLLEGDAETAKKWRGVMERLSHPSYE